MSYLQSRSARWSALTTAVRTRTAHRARPGRTGAAIVCAMALALGIATPAKAGEQVDQSNVVAPTTNFFAVFGARQFGQTFTVGTAGFLTRVEMYVDKRGTPAGALVAEVQGVSGGFPDGNVQASVSLAPASVVDGLNSFDVTAAGVAIEVGDELAIVLRSAGSSGGNDYLARAVPGNLYGAGQAVENPSGVWGTFGTVGQGFDAIFRTWVLPVEQPLPYGSATRRILLGSTFGFPFDPIDSIDGNADERTTTRWSFVIPAGWTYASGRLIDDGVSVGAYSATSGPVIRGSTAAVGAARAIAWRSFVNTNPTSVTCRVNAVMDGGFGGPAGGTATGFVYAFDATMMDATLDGVAPDVADYLLAGDGLAEIATGGNVLNLTGLFPPAAVLASGFEELGGLGDQTVPLNSSFMTLAPDQVFTVMFDVSVHSPGPGSVNFAETLSPAPVLFTDMSGMPVTGIDATGPVIDPDVPPASVVLAPENSSGPVGTTQTATATVTDGASAPIEGALVFFTITSGPNAGLSGPVTTDVNGLAEFSYADMSGTGGTDTIAAASGALQSNVVSITWTVPGELDYITISPLTVTVPPGQAVAYSTEAFDLFDNSRGDVTAQTAFSITDGTCTGASCSATTPGEHTVTADHNGAIATATLTVETDTDGDGVVDSADNCTVVANPAQLDTDGDGIGNFCDPDVAAPNDCAVNFLDLNVYKANFFQAGIIDTDNNGDGQTNFADLDILKDFFFGPPGPSATGCN